MELYGSQSGQEKGEWAEETVVEESVPIPRLNVWERDVYPERPGLPDCEYYRRTGSCAFGAKCRFNHPRDRATLLLSGEYPERVGEPHCLYYLRTRTCKFGASCKFDHPKNVGASLINVPTNGSGLPLRPGEKECSHYLKTGACKFGITCKFHHPYLPGTSMPASAPPFYPRVQSLSSLSPEQFESSPSNYRVARPPMLSGSYVPGAYGPPMLLHPGVVPVPNWNPYSGPMSPLSPGAPSSVGARPMYTMSPQMSSSPVPFTGSYPQVPSFDSRSGSMPKENQFAERPGQPDCKFYMKTGDCKFGSSCRYNHPPHWALLKASYEVNQIGLPLRPGVQACAFYMQNGHCKFGKTCKFDHPNDIQKYNQAPPYSEIPG